MQSIDSRTLGTRAICGTVHSHCDRNKERKQQRQKDVSQDLSTLLLKGKAVLCGVLQQREAYPRVAQRRFSGDYNIRLPSKGERFAKRFVVTSAGSCDKFVVIERRTLERPPLSPQPPRGVAL